MCERKIMIGYIITHVNFIDVEYITYYNIYYQGNSQNSFTCLIFCQGLVSPPGTNYIGLVHNCAYNAHIMHPFYEHFCNSKITLTAILLLLVNAALKLTFYIRLQGIKNTHVERPLYNPII